MMFVSRVMSQLVRTQGWQGRGEIGPGLPVSLTAERRKGEKRRMEESRLTPLREQTAFKYLRHVVYRRDQLRC